jgi:hypothetical protein
MELVLLEVWHRTVIEELLVAWKCWMEKDMIGKALVVLQYHKLAVAVEVVRIGFHQI